MTRTRSTHDPYRSERVLVPQVPRGLEPLSELESMTVLAHVDRYPPGQNAGAEWMLHHLLRPLVERGHRCVVTTATAKPYTLEGVEVYPAAAAPDLAAECDVIVGHLLWTDRQIDLAHTAKRPLVYLAHNDDQLRYWKLGPGDLTAVVWNSEWIEEAYRGSPCASLPSCVVRPPTRLEDYAVPGTPVNGEREFVTLVNPNPDKGGHLFLELAKRMPETRFLTVGGAYGQQLRAGPTLRNVEQMRPTANMRDDVYRRTRVLLVPSRYESWGRVAIEAMCQGIPVIAHPTPGLRESCGGAAILLDRDDPDAWVAALRDLERRAAWEEWSGLSLMRAAELDGQAETDLAEWERLLRLCAAVTRRGAVRPVAESGPDGRGQPAAAQEALTGAASWTPGSTEQGSN